MNKLYFGTAGIPKSIVPSSTLNGIKRVRELGLNAMELEFVRGVRMKENKAQEVQNLASEKGVKLTAHGPYYINLASEKLRIQESSKKRILDTARIAHLCKAVSITFHGGFYYKGNSETTYKLVRKNLEEVVETLGNEGNSVRVCPETMGKVKSFGKLDEIVSLCEEVDGIHPCLDFSHIHALKGDYNTFEEFASVLELVENRLGKDELKNLHAHLSGIEYGERGEKKHLFLEDSDMNYVDLLKVFKEFNCAGVLICESPEPESDAILLKRTFDEL